MKMLKKLKKDLRMPTPCWYLLAELAELAELA